MSGRESHDFSRGRDRQNLDNSAAGQLRLVSPARRDRMQAKYSRAFPILASTVTSSVSHSLRRGALVGQEAA